MAEVKHHHEDGSGKANSGTAIDPICGMTVEKATARYTSQYEGQIYYFCSDGCRASFNQDPARALQRARSTG